MVEENSAFSQSAFEPANEPAADKVMADANAGMDASKEFGFMQTLQVHSASVRSLAQHVKGDFMMSGSIDMTNKLYLLDSATGKYDF